MSTAVSPARSSRTRQTALASGMVLMWSAMCCEQSCIPIDSGYRAVPVPQPYWWYDEQNWQDCPIRDLAANPWMPDHRPVKLIVPWDSFYWGKSVGEGGNDYGLKWWWFDDSSDGKDCGGFVDHQWVKGSNGIPDVFDHLLVRLDDAFDAGWQRFVMHLPNGCLQSVPYAPSSQYWTMPAWKRRGFADYVKEWVLQKNEQAGPDDDIHVTFGVYGGYQRSDICSMDMTGAVTPYPNDMDDMTFVWRNLDPWFDDVQVSEYWFDACSSNYQNKRGAFLRITANPDYVDRHIGGECIPYDCIDTGRIPNEEAILRAPWMATHQFFEQVGWGAGGQNWDEQTTEIGLWLVHNTPTFAETMQYARHGCVLWVSYGTESDDYLNWVQQTYGPRWFPDVCVDCMCDLNSDGAVDITDLTIVNAGMGLSDSAGDKPWSNRGWITRAHGDVDGDGDVDAADQQIVCASFGLCP
ncbi:MAG: hypothetical protein KAS72_01285 [Phycisphaerales bacterium]|nr:hypothetical protein [Phycisphaerales bacterium]